MKIMKVLSRSQALFTALFIVLLLIYGASLHAQTTTGSIYGSVMDQSNAVVPHASHVALQLQLVCIEAGWLPFRRPSSC